MYHYKINIVLFAHISGHLYMLLKKVQILVGNAIVLIMHPNISKTISYEVYI